MQRKALAVPAKGVRVDGMVGGVCGLVRLVVGGVGAGVSGGLWEVGAL